MSRDAFPGWHGTTIIGVKKTVKLSLQETVRSLLDKQ